MRRGPARLIAPAAVLAAVLCLFLAGPSPMVSPAQAQSPPTLTDATLEPLSFGDLDGWGRDDQAEAFATFLRTCARLADPAPDLRPGVAMPPALAAVCRRALAEGPLPTERARAFLERWFRPWAVRPSQPGGAGFLTGYYEPEIPGSLVRDEAHPVAVLGRPADLLTLGPGSERGSLDPGLAAARRLPDGLVPYPDRAAIWDGALDGQGLELVYVPDRVELFLAQVQGSARVRLPDGRAVRLVYAGRNGHPYTSIGKVIVAEGHMALEEMTLGRLKAWLRAHPADADRIMRLNRSYIFFAVGEGLDPAQGPIGAASVPLTPWRSIAVDRTLWPYGLPFWIEAELPVAPGGGDPAVPPDTIAPGAMPPRPMARLMIAQDTGSAILGPARADLFMGSGAGAGDRAGLIRHPGRFTVLWPREDDR